MYLAEARGLEWQAIVRVRYFNIDYFASQFRNGALSARSIESDEEWESATWRYPACDSVDFAVELETSSGRYFTVSWDSPGHVEGLGLRELRAVGNAFDDDAAVALWDVTERSNWSDLIGKTVTEVDLHYQPWGGDSEAYWCDWVTVGFDGAEVSFLLADVEGADSDVPVPSADNVAVVFSPGTVPRWLTSRSE